ncbi:hypothetical protein PMAYCL1PPCAC_20726, partial [Pristionchus mayeri]
ESRLITTISDVCNDKMTVENAIQHIPKEAMHVKTIVKCSLQVLSDLPPSNTLHVLREKMSKNVTEEMEEVVPKAERNFFDLLIAIRDKGKLPNLCTHFYHAYLDYIFFTSMNTLNNATEEVTRVARCIFWAFVHTKSVRTNVNAAQIILIEILTKQ